MKFTSAVSLLALVATANAFVAPSLPPNKASTSTSSATSLEVIRSKNFKRAKLIDPEVDTAGVVKAGVS